jgi:hypothetical protein
MRHRRAWSLVVCGLLLLTFCLGLPQFHYAVALMISVIVRYSDRPLNEPLFRYGPLPVSLASGEETKGSS